MTLFCVEQSFRIPSEGNLEDFTEEIDSLIGRFPTLRILISPYETKSEDYFFKIKGSEEEVNEFGVYLQTRN
ncbi:MAG: hypothetical protein AABY03_02205 [Nanoarchaeota archaeon]